MTTRPRLGQCAAACRADRVPLKHQVVVAHRAMCMSGQMLELLETHTPIYTLYGRPACPETCVRPNMGDPHAQIWKTHTPKYGRPVHPNTPFMEDPHTQIWKIHTPKYGRPAHPNMEDSHAQLWETHTRTPKYGRHAHPSGRLAHPNIPPPVIATPGADCAVGDAPAVQHPGPVFFW